MYLRFLFLSLLLAGCAGGPRERPALERVRVAADGRGFVLHPSGRPFTPWGFNYDHDEAGRLLEDYWIAEWPRVAADFAEMKALGATVVRVHLQFGRFMRSATEPDPDALAQLGKLVALAERTGLYLDVTGLGCYHKQEVPAWYDALDEAGRWAAQARFWETVAARCRASPAVFCYDLMNEPVVPGGKGKAADWLGPAFGGKHFVQLVTLDAAGRTRPEVARQWIEHLTRAVRRQDREHLVTVGLVDWSLDRPGLTSGFVPQLVAGPLDFVCVHLYPESGKLDEAMTTLAGFAIGKPIVIEETFSLKCGGAEFEAFLKRSAQHASGWVSFYWGSGPEELRRRGDLQSAIVADGLDRFVRARPQ